MTRSIGFILKCDLGLRLTFEKGSKDDFIHPMIIDVIKIRQFDVNV